MLPLETGACTEFAGWLTVKCCLLLFPCLSLSPFCLGAFTGILMIFLEVHRSTPNFFCPSSHCLLLTRKEHLTWWLVMTHWVSFLADYSCVVAVSFSSQWSHQHWTSVYGYHPCSSWVEVCCLQGTSPLNPEVSFMLKHGISISEVHNSFPNSCICSLIAPKKKRWSKFKLQ